METRSVDKIFLLNHDESQIIGTKLPSNGQVLRVLFYNLRKVKLDLRSSAANVIKEVEVFWEKARIPQRKTYNSVTKLIELYQNWRQLQRSNKRRSESQEKKEQEFLESMDDLFDIAHQDALNKIKIEEDRLFLLNQRKKGREGSMIGTDRTLANKELRKAIRIERAESWKHRHGAIAEMEGTYFSNIFLILNAF